MSQLESYVGSVVPPDQDQLRGMNEEFVVVVSKGVARNPMEQTTIIGFDRPDTEDALRLILQLDEGLFQRYPTPKATQGLRHSDSIDPNFTFLIAQIGGTAVGCGALRVIGTGVCEVKRMFVFPQFRGRGIARRMLKALKSRSRELGNGGVQLETGAGQPEAIALYRCTGYRDIPGFGEYLNNAFNVCFEKRLL